MEAIFALISSAAALFCGAIGGLLTYHAIRNNFEPWKRVRYKLFVAGLAIAGFGALLLLPFIPPDSRWIVLVFASLAGPLFAYAYVFRTPRDWQQIQHMKKSRAAPDQKETSDN